MRRPPHTRDILTSNSAAPASTSGQARATTLYDDGAARAGAEPPFRYRVAEAYAGDSAYCRTGRTMNRAAASTFGPATGSEAGGLPHARAGHSRTSGDVDA